ncbi:MAG: hypothetical protein ACP5JY_03210 [Candidatus Nanoarchaeia archaeon]
MEFQIPKAKLICLRKQHKVELFDNQATDFYRKMQSPSYQFDPIAEWMGEKKENGRWYFKAYPAPSGVYIRALFYPDILEFSTEERLYILDLV